MSEAKNNNYETIHETPFSKIEMRCHYPHENPPRAKEDITRTLQYIGLFDNLK